MNKTARLAGAIGIATMLAFLSPAPTQAQLSLGLDFEFSGATPPASATTPWTTANFEDITGGVRLTMSTVNLIGNEFVSSWYFNLAPDLNPNALVFNRTDASSVVVNSVSTGSNAFKADGDGFFDVIFEFSTSGRNAGAERFTGGRTVVFEITGINGLNSSMFNFASVLGGGNGTYLSAAHVQGITVNQNGDRVGARGGDINGDASGWIGARIPDEPIPEPATVVILGSFVAFAVYLKRRMNA